MPGANAASYAESVLQSIGNPLETLKSAQVTTTTMAGGMASVEVRIQDLLLRPEHEAVEPPDPDPEDEPTEEEEFDAGEGPNNAKVINCDISFQECPLPTHPYFADLAEAHDAIRDAIGMVHKGHAIHRPIPVDEDGNMHTPYEILGEEDCALLQSVHSFNVRVLNITYSYVTRRSMTDKCSSQKIGEKIKMTDLPKNQLGGKFGTNGSAYFLGRNVKYNTAEKCWEVEERYIVEVVPTIEEVKRHGDKEEE